MYLLLCIAAGFGAISLSLLVLATWWPEYKRDEAYNLLMQVCPPLELIGMRGRCAVVHWYTALLIDDDSVLKLCALQDNISYLRVNKFWINHTHFFSVTKHDDFDAKIKEINEFIGRNLKSSEDHEKQIEELKNRVFTLEYQIEKFNSSRHWWERKLKIKE